MSSYNNTKGLILITSCHKHLNTRIKELVLPEKSSWPIIIVIGDPSLEQQYIFRDDGIMVIKCEDSYFHLLKKIYTTIEILLKIYSVEQGILVCGDDTVFNYEQLEKFLELENKSDYTGFSAHVNPELPKKEYNTFISNYWLTHVDEHHDSKNGIQGIDIGKMSTLPNVANVAGCVRYVSLKTIGVILNYMQDINWDCFHYDEIYGYITLCEDLGSGAILQMSNIFPVHDSMLVTGNENEFNTGQFAAWSTNKYK